MRRTLLSGLVLALLPAAAYADTELVYRLQVGNKTVGTRTLSIQEIEEGETTRRFLSSFTDIDAEGGLIPYTFQQRVTGTATVGPASFTSTMDDNGTPWQLQARLVGQEWVVSELTRRGPKVEKAKASSITHSTLDLMDPHSTIPIYQYDELRVLSAETGEVWRGEVELVETETLTLGKRSVSTQRYRWQSPEGPVQFWYDVEGVLVRYEMRLYGIKLQGTLAEAPPMGPDIFAVRTGKPKVEELASPL